jgi:diacylglycerol kinase family enzyme
VTVAGETVPDKEATAATVSAVVVNPSKVTDLDQRRREICDALARAGWPEPMWLETTPEDPGCGQTRQALDAGAKVVFACGGDGTVMACATELTRARADAALAIIPSGTGNLLATNLGLSSDVEAAVGVATNGERRRIDVGSVGSGSSTEGGTLSGGTAGARCFTVMGGMGFDAQMLDGAPERLKRRIGWPAYVVAALKRLRDRPVRVRIRLDGGPPIRRRARTVLVANVGRLQGGIPLLPDAEPDDGWLDVAVLTPHSLWHWLGLAWGVIRRRPEVPRMETFRARRVDITSDREQARELDGDVIEPGRSLSVVVAPGALCLCVPRAA